jgi:glycosyltransferase involved in cell wall biosynthesis
MTLPACLRSLARQTEPEWECVLVDDGSTDGTLAVARAAAGRDPRIRVIAQPHTGLVGALTTGLDACQAPIVARMDADDLMHRERLAAQLAALAQTSDLIGVGTWVRVFPRRTMTDGMRAYEGWLNGIDTPTRVRAEAFVESPIVHPTLTIRRDVLAAMGYRDAGWPEDYDLMLRLLAAGHAIGVVPRRLLAWRDGPARLTRAHPTYGLDRITACKAAFLAGGLLAASDRYVLWGHGGTGRALRRALAAHGKRPSHVVELHPGRIGNRIDGAPVIRPEALATLPRGPLVASVAGEAARTEIRALLDRLGYRETRDYVCAA